MDNLIKLEFDKMVVDLAGNSLGRRVFDNQVENKFKDDSINIVIIPASINDVGSSFIQGMYYKISETYGKSKALKLMKIDCEKTDVLEKIQKSIEAYGV